MYNEIVMFHIETLERRKVKKRTIKGLRCDLELTQRQMAEKLGIGIVTYQRYEQYKCKIPVDLLVRIADMSGIVDIREIKYC